MLNHPPTCPQCGLADKAYKVSLLYQESSTRFQHNEQDHQPELDGLLKDLCSDPTNPADVAQVLGWLTQSFAPPESAQPQSPRRAVTISPDLLVAGAGLIMLLLAGLVAVHQPENLPTALLILVAALLIYLAVRRPIMQRYRARIQKDNESQQRAGEATSRWMRLYYCSRDRGVFDPEQNRLVAVEQIQHLLYEV